MTARILPINPDAARLRALELLERLAERSGGLVDETDVELYGLTRTTDELVEMSELLEAVDEPADPAGLADVAAREKSSRFNSWRGDPTAGSAGSISAGKRRSR